MTDAELNQYAMQIVDAVQDPSIYTRANVALAQARARQVPCGLMGGLALPDTSFLRRESWAIR